MAYFIFVLNVKYVIIVSTLVNQLEYVLNALRKTVCPSPHLPDVTKSVLARFAIVPVSEVTCQTVYVTIQSHVAHVTSGSSVQCLITYAIYYIAVIVQNLSNQITSVLLKWKKGPMSNRGDMFSTTLSVLKIRLTLKQNDPSTKLMIVLLCVYMIHVQTMVCVMTVCQFIHSVD